MEIENLAEKTSVSAEAILRSISRNLHPKAPEDTCYLGLSQSLFDADSVEDCFSFYARSSLGRQLHTLLSFGLPFIQIFLGNSSKRKKDLIHKYGRTWCYDIDEALQFALYHDRSGSAEPRTLVPVFDEDSPDRANNAWIWAKHNNGKNNFCRTYDHDLRALGYVFWDQDRLQKTMRLMDEARPKTKWPSCRDPMSPRRWKVLLMNRCVRDTDFLLSPHERPKPAVDIINE